LYKNFFETLLELDDVDETFLDATKPRLYVNIYIYKRHTRN